MDTNQSDRLRTMITQMRSDLATHDRGIYYGRFDHIQFSEKWLEPIQEAVAEHWDELIQAYDTSLSQHNDRERALADATENVLGHRLCGTDQCVDIYDESPEMDHPMRWAVRRWVDEMIDEAVSERLNVVSDT